MANTVRRQSRQARQRTHRSEGGFSTLEMILVITFIGLLSAVAIARWPSIPKSGPAARRLARDIQYAKQLANRLQTMSGVYFIDSTSYRVFQDNDTGTATMDPVTGKDFVVTLSGKFSGVTLSQSFANNTLKFDALGTPFDGADTPLAAVSTITVSGPEGNRSVTVEPNTGKVSEL